MIVYSISWSIEAEQTFNQNIEYLAKEWSNKVLNQFLDRVDEVLQKIENNPFLYPPHHSSISIRKCVINQRIVLYYRVDKTFITLVSFWNTYKNPDKLNF